MSNISQKACLISATRRSPSDPLCLSSPANDRYHEHQYQDQSRPVTDHTPKGTIYHVGDHKYVTLDDYSQAFEDYEWDHNGAEWACYLYALIKNNPERIDFYIQAYNIGGMETLEAVYNNVTESTPMTIVYPIYKH